MCTHGCMLVSGEVCCGLGRCPRLWGTGLHYRGCTLMGGCMCRHQSCGNPATFAWARPQASCSEVPSTFSCGDRPALPLSASMDHILHLLSREPACQATLEVTAPERCACTFAPYMCASGCTWPCACWVGAGCQRPHTPCTMHYTWSLRSPAHVHVVFWGC